MNPIFALTDDDYHEVDDLDDGEAASEDQLARWNDHDAFQRFLTREAAREREEFAFGDVREYEELEYEFDEYCCACDGWVVFEE